MFLFNLVMAFRKAWIFLDLNTSYVPIQYYNMGKMEIERANLNTSYVPIQWTKTLFVKDEYLFKYIICSYSMP